MTGAPLFRTVPQQDRLGFWAGRALDARKVADFLGLDKPAIARLAAVAPASVRFDHKIPKEVAERLSEVANLCELVVQYFGGNAQKTALWFKTPNPQLGGISPRDMIGFGRCERLRRFITEALDLNAGPAPEAAATVPAVPGNPMTDLITRHRPALTELCQRFGVRRLGVFGSVLREDFDAERSDVDLTVEFAPTEALSPWRQYFDFKAELEALFQRPVDLVELSAMPDSRLKRLIERTQVPVYAQAA
ncbi:MAG TPA: nucleotidyltransferase domain-containing protein [Steroidobacteraceae bacterium]|nr:nucleotidyltransferase domain-containing protein [Steroidobacteraceae bacterium]